MSSVSETILIVGGGMLASAVGVYVVRRRFREKDFSSHHEVAGYFLAVVSTLYAVLLGLIVVSAQSKYDEARVTAELEANCCSDLANFSRGFPPEARNSILKPLKEYYSIVQQEDWQDVSEGAKEESIPAYQSLWRAIGRYEPQGNREVSCYSSVLSTMKSLSDARRYRMFARKRALSPIVWTVLALGAVMTIVFTYFFWVESFTIQMVLTIFVALFITLNLLLVRLFDNPYRRDLFVKEGAFSFDAKVFDGSAPQGRSPEQEREVEAKDQLRAAREIQRIKDAPDPVLK